MQDKKRNSNKTQHWTPPLSIVRNYSYCVCLKETPLCPFFGYIDCWDNDHKTLELPQEFHARRRKRLKPGASLRRNVAPRKRCCIVLRTNGSLDNGGGHSLTLVRHTSCLLLKPRPHARTQHGFCRMVEGRLGIQRPVCYSFQSDSTQEIFLRFSKDITLLLSVDG